jgi:hypothetical protein
MKASLSANKVAVLVLVLVQRLLVPAALGARLIPGGDGDDKRSGTEMSYF